MMRRRVAGVVAMLAVVGGAFVAGRISETDTSSRVLAEKALPQVVFEKFRMLCPFTHSNHDDPIVNKFPPGAQGASHLHRYFGNPTTKWNSTLQTQLAATGTCTRQVGAFGKFAEPKDTAGYWITDFLFLDFDTTNEGATAWYSNPDACPSARPCNGIGVMPVNYTFPQNFKMIVGTSTATSPAGNEAIASDNIFFNCYPALGKTFGHDEPGGDPDGLNECADKGGKRADIWMRFRSCWVGRGGNPSWTRDAGGWVTDSPNHQDHVAYPTKDGCPASHPIVLPQLTVQIPFNAINGSTMSFSSGKWHTLHFDFWQTWDQQRLEQLTAPSPPIPATSSPVPSPSPKPSPTRTR